jgi:hypothetical protein
MLLSKPRVLVTSKASYFNLGGHVDSAGIVDSIASSRLRDALKEHKNFARLPPDIRTHILTHGPIPCCILPSPAYRPRLRRVKRLSSVRPSLLMSV